MMAKPLRADYAYLALFAVAVLGIIALQNDFITREALVAGFDAWVHDKSRTLAEILQSQGALSADDREVLDRLVARQAVPVDEPPDAGLHDAYGAAVRIATRDRRARVDHGDHTRRDQRVGGGCLPERLLT